MFRSGGQSDAKPSMFSSQASLVAIYQPTEGMKGRVDLFQTGFEPRTCGGDARYVTTQPLGFYHSSIIYYGIRLSSEP
ncbi:hypothetical protein TNCV_778731 [Trichonephila clavipes]|nr:hypothetical protein TNCV_778731 [Trichonephila clavipes]